MQQPTGQFVYINNGAGLQPANQNIVTYPQNQQQSQQYVVVVPAPVQQFGQNGAYANYKRSASRVLGALQIVMGLLLIAMNIGMAIVDYNYTWTIGAGWWASPLFILAGSFGIIAGSRPSSCKVITTMVLSIVSCVTVVSVVTQGTLALVAGQCWDWYCGYYGSGPAHYSVSSFFLLFGLCEGAFALAQSILCCQSCCKPTVTQPNNQTMVQQAYANGGFVPCYVNSQAPVQNTQMTLQPMRQPVQILPQAGATGQTVPMATAQTDDASGATIQQPPAYTKEQEAYANYH